MRTAPHPTDVQVGRRLREQRTLRGLSQERLGSLLGVTYQQIQKYERGTNRIGSSRLEELARALAVPVAYFFELPAPGQGLAEGAPGFDLQDAPGIDGPAGDAGVEVDRRETLELVRAFNRIADPQIRRRVLELARALAAAAAAHRRETPDRRDA
jgi:transcriptional regulator with XRE-family HTH domain